MARVAPIRSVVLPHVRGTVRVNLVQAATCLFFGEREAGHDRAYPDGLRRAQEDVEGVRPIGEDESAAAADDDRIPPPGGLTYDLLREQLHGLLRVGEGFTVPDIPACAVGFAERRERADEPIHDALRMLVLGGHCVCGEAQAACHFGHEPPIDHLGLEPLRKHRRHSRATGTELARDRDHWHVAPPTCRPTIPAARLYNTPIIWIIQELGVQ